MIHFKVERKYLKAGYTIGNLFYKIDQDWIWLCNTMEPPVGTNQHGEAIPTGFYKLIVNYSPKLETRAPRLLNVPERTDILWHWGNYPKDTIGCLLVGVNSDVGELHSSYVTFKQIMELLQANYQSEYEVLYTQINE
jgi:hypothetical protein